jgi:hypothetical protein
MLTRKRIWAVVLLAVTFAAGAMVGGAASAAWGDHGRAPRSAAARRAGFTATLDRELKLTPAQHDSVQAILKRYDPAMRAAWDQMRPRFDSLRANIHADILSVLDEPQRAAFQRWSSKMDSASRKRNSKEGEGVR